MPKDTPASMKCKTSNHYAIFRNQTLLEGDFMFTFTLETQFSGSIVKSFHRWEISVKAFCQKMGL